MLPKIPSKIVTTILPSTQKPIKFRPWQAREEKLLLMAKDGNDKEEILSTVSQVVGNIVLDDGFDASAAPVFDVEWLFVQSRIASVGPVVSRSYVDKEDKLTYQFDIDLTKVELIREPVDNNIIDFGEGIAVTLKWPSASAFATPEIVNGDDDMIASLLVPDMIDKIYEGDKVYDASTYKREELVQFVDTFPTTDHARAVEYLAAMPHLEYKIEYKNSLGHERKFSLSNLTDFFTFR